MCKDGVTNSEPKKKGSQLKPFTPLTARDAQAASVRARNARKAFRAQLLQAAISDGHVGELYLQALKKGDLDQLTLVEKALKIVGLTHDQSEEVVNKLQIDAKTDNKTELIGQVDFVVKK